MHKHGWHILNNHSLFKAFGSMGLLLAFGDSNAFKFTMNLLFVTQGKVSDFVR